MLLLLQAGLPIFFSTWDFDPSEDNGLTHPKSGGMIYVRTETLESWRPSLYLSFTLIVSLCLSLTPQTYVCPQDENTTPEMMEIDPRLKRRPGEKLFPKRYASCFSGTCYWCVGAVVLQKVSRLTACMQRLQAQRCKKC